jgi:hypothetical protein
VKKPRTVEEDSLPLPQDWSKIEVDDRVKVIDNKSTGYEAIIDAKTQDSTIIWIRRTDLGTRQLVDHRDRLLLVPLTPNL